MFSSNGYEQVMNVQVVRSADQVSTALQGEVVILQVKSGKYFNLNAVGSRIWELMEQPCKVVFIVETILAEYAVERQRCEQDVYKIIRALHEAGLVEIVNSPAASPASGA